MGFAQPQMLVIACCFPLVRTVTLRFPAKNMQTKEKFRASVAAGVFDSVLLSSSLCPSVISHKTSREVHPQSCALSLVSTHHSAEEKKKQREMSLMFGPAAGVCSRAALAERSGKLVVLRHTTSPHHHLQRERRWRDDVIKNLHGFIQTQSAAKKLLTSALSHVRRFNLASAPKRRRL